LADDAYGATIGKRILSWRLATFRAATGYTANHVCDLLNWGRGKLGRIEANLWKRPEWDDVQDLLRLYGVTGVNRDEVEELTLLACAKAWWHDFPEIFDSEFPGYENDAVTIRTSAPLILPGLLQTRAYIESMLQTEFRSPAWRRKAMNAHLRRQEILNGTHAIALSVVITEASLRYRWGTYNDRCEQLGHLIDIAEQSNFHLRIQRFDDGPPIGANTTINIFGFDGGNPDIVFIETGHTIEEVDSWKLAGGHMQSFHDACEGALDPDDTLRYLKRLTQRAHFGSQQVILASSRYQEVQDRHTEPSLVRSADTENSAAEQERTFDAGASPNIDRISVAAYVDGSPYAMRQVLSGVDKLVHALGYGDPLDEGIEQGSIFRKYFASIRRGISSSVVQERTIKVERALELLTIDSKQAQVDGQAAAAVQNLVNSLSEVPTACVRVGSILLIKYTGVDGAVVLVRTLSQVEIRALERFPEIQRKPEKVLEALAFALTQGESSSNSNPG
jgi:Domain of unknown function (DUF5753)/Helix-turn-helix domain